MWVAQDCAMANIVASMLEKTTCMYGYNRIIKVSHPLQTKHYGVVYIVARLACLSWSQIFFFVVQKGRTQKALCSSQSFTIGSYSNWATSSFDESNEIYVQYKFQTKWQTLQARHDGKEANIKMIQTFYLGICWYLLVVTKCLMRLSWIL